MTFKPTGEFQLTLARVGINDAGERDWQTVLEVTNSPAAISALLPFVAEIAAGDAPSAGIGTVASMTPGTEAGNAEGPKRGRPRKAPAPAVGGGGDASTPDPVTVQQPTAPAPETPTVPAMAAPAEADAAPVAPKFNPFV